MKLNDIAYQPGINEDDLLKSEVFQKILNEDQQVQNLRGPFTANRIRSILCFTESIDIKEDSAKNKPTFMYTKTAERSVGELSGSGLGQILSKLDSFIQFKSQNPIAAFGSKDYPFRGEGPLAGYRHAHLNRDWFVVYKYDGKANQFCIYGVFTHKDLGIGDRANPSKMKSMRASFDQQAC